MTKETTLDEWMILELLGHRRIAGHVREVQVAGAGFLRVDIPPTVGHAAQTQFVAPGSIYAMHPVTEDVATRFVAKFRTPPVHRFELAPDPWDADEAEKQDAAEVAYDDAEPI